MKGSLACALLILAGCKTLPPLPESTLASLKGSAYLKGVPTGLLEPRVLNDVDFVYDAKFSDDSRRVAISRLGMHTFDVVVWAAGEKVCEASVNKHEFDVEAVAFSPDGAHVASVSRDGTLRVFDAVTGKPGGGWITEEPLISLAFHPSGRYLALGSETGLVTVLAMDAQVKFRFATELQVHQGSVRALAFTADGRLITASWDKSIAVLTAQEQATAANAAAVHFERKGGYAQLRGTINDVASVLLALDARMPQVLVLRSALAQAIGIDPTQLTETVSVTSSFGPQLARVAHGVRLSFKGMKLENLDAVVCDACIPADAQAVLGAGFTEKVTLAFDETRAQAVLERKAASDTKSDPLLTLTEEKRFTFPAFPNDLSIDRAGKVLGVAFSETRAERTKEVYLREKRKEVEPEREWDVGARIDAQTGSVLQKVHGHRGVVSTAAISPDGRTLATGGWDKRVLLHIGPAPVVEKFGLAVRRVRFSPDGRWLAVAAWTPQNALGNNRSDRSAVLWELAYSSVEVVAP